MLKKTIAYGFSAIWNSPYTNSVLTINPKYLQEISLMMRYIGRKATAPLSNLYGDKASLCCEI
ncbi:MAG: hypothetical protein MRJ67_02915 [Nitrospirales bacterium]|nr:hypothetical protein [Nitrospirales bacterium]MDR4484932.1 hypothetical protein [Nitrospirales bacterium]